MSEDDKKHGQDIEDRIREVAYLMWEQAGRLSDMAHEYWVAAEKQVLATWQTAAEKVLPGEKAEKAGKPKTEASMPAPSEAPKPSKAPAKSAAKAPRAKKKKAEADRTIANQPAEVQTKAKATARAEPRKPSSTEPGTLDASRPPKVVAEPAGKTPRKAEATAIAQPKVATETGEKKEREGLRKRTTRRTGEKIETRRRMRRSGKT